MSIEPPRPRYTSLLRARQKEQTAVLILEAVATILRRADLAAVTIPEVARVAGVTERTVYRHYKTRDDLLKAVWPWLLEQMGGQNTHTPRSMEGFLRALREIFEGWDRDPGLVRAVFVSPENRQMRDAVMANYIRYINGFLDDILPDTPDVRRRQIAAVVVSLCSVGNWLFMHDSCGYTGKQSAEATVRGIELMLEGARSEARGGPAASKA